MAHGTEGPANLTTAEEMRYAAAWHLASALALTVVLAHVYLRTFGMEGAFSAMGSGQVDVNWAKQHHSLWAEREIQGGGCGGRQARVRHGTRGVTCEAG